MEHLIMQESDRYKNVMILSLNRSERLNAVNAQVIAELRAALTSIADDPCVNALIISSRITKAFCAGVDVSYVKGLSNEEAAEFFGEVAEVLEQLIQFPLPTISAVNGFAYGAGADLALACDIRIGGISSSYRFPGPQFGLILGTNRLIAELGPSVSRFLTMTNEVLDAEAALQFGLIHEIAEDHAVLERALQRASAITQMPQYALQKIKILTAEKDSSRLALELTKESVLHSDFKQRFSTYLDQMKEKKKQGGK